MKALLLAAGLGTRLRPLTSFRPKPLCLFFSEVILDIVYRQIKATPIAASAVNTHHLAPLIEQHMADRRLIYSPQPRLSFEPEILGTGGSINPLREWLNEDDLLIYNGDIIADIDLNSLITQHLSRRADATMVVLKQHRTGTNPVFYEPESQRIVQIGGSSEQLPATFTGVHIIGPRLQRAIPMQGFHHVIDSYNRLLTDGAQIEAFVHEGFWADLGTPVDYFKAHHDLMQSPHRSSLMSSFGLDNHSNKKAWRFEENSFCLDPKFSGSIKNSFILGPAGLETVRSIRNCLVYPASQADAYTDLNSMIITPYGNFSLE